MNKPKINEIFTIFHSQNPQPKTELEYKNNYTLLLAVILSAQTTDVNVNKATKNLFAIADTPEKILEIGEDVLKKYIKTIGLYNNKAKNIIALSKILLEKYNSSIPHNFEELKSLPGVGRKTANVVLNCAFGEKRIAVDTHVFRVSNRIGIVNEKDVLKTEISLLKAIPEQFLAHAHHWLILHGRYICTARKPKCAQCQIVHLCDFKEKNLIDDKK